MQHACRLFFWTTTAAIAVVLSGCAAPAPIEKPAVAVEVDPGQVCLFTRDGAPVTWLAMMRELIQCDAVFLGESHDDAHGHALEARIVLELLAAWPSGALSMEMLERDEQIYADQWRIGKIDAQMLAEKTNSLAWAGKGSWMAWYQPILDDAKYQGGVIIAANAPRKYVRTVSKEGMQALPPVTSEERALFDVPALKNEGYREDFRAFMVEMRQEEGQPTPVVTDEEVDKFIAAQLMWDATMAHSAANARPKYRVVHIAGCFHIDRSGATVAEFKNLRPYDKVATVSLVSSDACEFDQKKDKDRATFIIYTQSRRDAPKAAVK
ncbi:MAG: ChaN family lipoprotein [Planctomycetes bacterium]|nr:ChaN family lipoprotein [Planctomycetota bacterium]